MAAAHLFVQQYVQDEGLYEDVKLKTAAAAKYQENKPKKPARFWRKKKKAPEVPK